ncbi:hypothetical protein HC891_22110, partial [Candidatus Gracilibacteria bacterium]|nr:hypothetical protein [Candidatus Gracilibacteria bacterium]
MQPVLRGENPRPTPDEPLRAGVVVPVLPALAQPGEAILTRYEAALRLAALDEPLLLAQLAPGELQALLPLLAALVPDPAPLYQHAWASGAPSAATLLLLARCIAERPTSAAVWGRRVAVVLAQESEDEQIAVARAVLEPVLSHLLDARDPQSFALFADTAWPPSRSLLALLDDITLLAPLRWAAADALCRRVPPLRLLTTGVRLQGAEGGISRGPEIEPSDRHATTVDGDTLDVLARAARAYIIATAMPEEHGQLAQPEARNWVRALLGEAIDRYPAATLRSPRWYITMLRLRRCACFCCPT